MNQVPKPVLKSSSSKYLKKVNFKLDQVSKLDSLKQRRLQKIQNVSPQDDGWYKVDQQDDQMDIQIIKNDKLNQNDLEKDGWVKIQVNQNSEKLSYLDQMLPDSQENLIQSNIKSNKQINYNQQLKSTNTQDIPQEIQNKDEIIQEQFEDIQQQSQAKLNQFDIEQPIQEKLNDQNNHDKQNQLKNLQEQPLQEQNLNRQNDDLQDNQFQNQNNQNQESQLETGQQIRHKSVEFNFENESFQNHFTEKSNIADIPINEEDLYIQSENPKMYLDKALSQQAYSAADDIQFKMKKSISDFQSDTSQQNIKDIEPINDYVTNPIDTQINNNKLQSNVGTLKESQIDGISHDNYSSEQENYHNQAIQSEHIPKVQFVETKKSNIFDEMQIESNGKPLSDLGLPAQKISLFPKVEFKEIQDVQKNISIKQFQDKMKSIIENKLKQHFFSSLRIFNMLQNRCLKNKCDSKLIIFQKLVENLQKKKKSSKAECNFDDYEDYIPIKVCIKNTQKLKDFSITETKSISIDYAKVS